MQRQVGLNVEGKRSFSRKVRSFFKWLGIIVVLIVLIGFASQQISTRVTADKFAPVGKMVDVGDYQLHMYATGQSNGLPTIILESGLGTPSPYKDWEQIQKKLSEHTRVISYDRAGYGWSESAENERTAEQIADDLHQLLVQSGEKGPFILVGHSFGGFSSQVFAHKYKEEVAGLVLIDSSNVDREGGISKSGLYIMRGLTEIGVGRVLDLINMLPMHEYFINDKLSKHFFHQHYYNANQMSEIEFMMTKSVKQVKDAQAEGFGEIPLRILSALHEEYPNWSELQEKTATLSTNSKHMVVKDASHYIHLDQPELVVETIMETLENKE